MTAINDCILTSMLFRLNRCIEISTKKKHSINYAVFNSEKERKQEQTDEDIVILFGRVVINIFHFAIGSVPSLNGTGYEPAHCASKSTARYIYQHD